MEICIFAGCSERTYSISKQNAGEQYQIPKADYEAFREIYSIKKGMNGFIEMIYIIPITAKNMQIKYKNVEVFADNVVYYIVMKFKFRVDL